MNANELNTDYRQMQYILNCCMLHLQMNDNNCNGE